MAEKKRFSINPKSALELADQLQKEVEELKSENKKLKYKLNTIDDYYQDQIERIQKEWENKKLIEIERLNNKINILESRALSNPRKITDNQITNVKTLRALGLSYRKIAERTALGTTTICRIINGEYDKEDF
ncbi:hypothetical protein [Clostridium sp. HBUAS56017]|uniref:hypothetical protein n=1 Tax=Clostridium sp. HBUAS56017 TaxID=2571128 RepID=UPI0011774E67|nr:hypothetical protein [Clostridium sp. HBUAS56017]